MRIKAAPRISDYFPPLLLGALSFIIGFLYSRRLVTHAEITNLSVEVSEFVLHGWVYYNSHFVPLEERVSGWGMDGASSGGSVIDPAYSPDYLEFLYLIPPSVLIVAGILAAANMRVSRTPSGAIMGGASIVFGYFLAVAVGLLVFTAQEGALGLTATMRPAIIESLVIAGVLYPVIFGAIGGLLFFFTQARIKVEM